MKLKKIEGQSVDTSLLFRMGNKIIIGGRGGEGGGGSEEEGPEGWKWCLFLL